MRVPRASANPAPGASACKRCSRPVPLLPPGSPVSLSRGHSRPRTQLRGEEGAGGSAQRWPDHGRAPHGPKRARDALRFQPRPHVRALPADLGGTKLGRKSPRAELGANPNVLLGTLRAAPCGHRRLPLPYSRRGGCCTPGSWTGTPAPRHPPPPKPQQVPGRVAGSGGIPPPQNANHAALHTPPHPQPPVTPAGARVGSGFGGQSPSPKPQPPTSVHPSRRWGKDQDQGALPLPKPPTAHLCTPLCTPHPVPIPQNPTTPQKKPIPPSPTPFPPINPLKPPKPP